jgi:outer membrane biosynthesis protein TonB
MEREFIMRWQFLVGSLLIAAALSGQTSDSQQNASAATVATPSLGTTNEVTVVLEQFLKKKGLDPPPAVAGPLPNIDVTINGKKPVTPPTPPPPPPPPPTPPIGPEPYKIKPPQLESYREAMEVLRREIEKERVSENITADEYDNGIAEYRRRIELYRQAHKIVATKKE